MKYLLFFSLFTFSIFGQAQSYNIEIEKAGNFLRNKDFCQAYLVFEKSLNHKESSYFDYYYGAISAINCNKEGIAINWLNEAKNKGLGLQNGELDYLTNDTSFQKIHNSENWKLLIASIKSEIINKENTEKEQKKVWLESITENNISTNKKNGKFSTVKSGYALYFSEINSQKVPYLVYIPKNYSSEKPSKMIVFLHGGVVSISDYYFENPEIQKEPIFKYGEENSTIIIYPFAKKDFGWVNQLDAFKNVVTITEVVQKKYNIDRRNIFLGGMSNGGTAAFWFATQKKMPFKGYFAISALPKLQIGEINFKNISKPLYSINSKDDDVFKFDEVRKIHELNLNKNWHFETINTGGHGVLYSDNGQQLLDDLLKKLTK